MVILESGTVIAINVMTYPYCLHVSSNDVLYLADSRSGVNQSKDDGVTWSLLFATSNGCSFSDMVKMNNDSQYEFWATERKKGADEFILRVYTA